MRYDDSTGEGIYRVRVGPIREESQFDALAARLAALDIGPQLVAESLQPANPPPAP